jgi:hypothetical protein
MEDDTIINTCDKGTRLLKVRKDWYKSEEWQLLHAEQRTKFGRIDIGGCWDGWWSRWGQWLFEQVGPVTAKQQKIRDCLAWIHKNGVFGDEPNSNALASQIIYRLALYRNPGWYGAGKNKKYISTFQWEVYEYFPNENNFLLIKS